MIQECIIYAIRWTSVVVDHKQILLDGLKIKYQQQIQIIMTMASVSSMQ